MEGRIAYWLVENQKYGFPQGQQAQLQKYFYILFL